MYDVDGTRPFPASMRADPKAGAFFERLSDDGQSSRYVVVRAKPFMSARVRELLAGGQVTLDDIYPELASMEEPPDQNAPWLYAVESFDVGRQFHADSASFADHAQNYCKRHFDDFNKVIRYCACEFSIGLEDFKKSQETNYPQS